MNNTGTSHTVTATLTDSDGAPVDAANIEFEVTGANPTSGSGTTDSNGEADFSYVGTNVGNDTIVATYDADGDGVFEATASATKEWVNNPPDCSQAAADDGQGGTCQGSVTVTVPHDQKPGNDAVDSGQAYDSTT